MVLCGVIGEKIRKNTDQNNLEYGHFSQDIGETVVAETRGYSLL